MILFLLLETVKLLFGCYFYCMLGGLGLNHLVCNFQALDPRLDQWDAIALGAAVTGYGMTLITFYEYLNALAAKFMEVIG